MNIDELAKDGFGATMDSNQVERPIFYVYSGNCRRCECGKPTGIEDDMGRELKTGDIVMSYTVDIFGVSNFNGLTVVVSDQFQSYSDGTHVEKEDEPEYFVMGIRYVDLDLETGVYPDSVWRVRRLKKFSEVIDGESWESFGFSYKLA